MEYFWAGAADALDDVTTLPALFSAESPSSSQDALHRGAGCGATASLIGRQRTGAESQE